MAKGRKQIRKKKSEAIVLFCCPVSRKFVVKGLTYTEMHIFTFKRFTEAVAEVAYQKDAFKNFRKFHKIHIGKYVSGSLFNKVTTGVLLSFLRKFF